MNDLENRIERLENLLLPERDYLPDLYDTIILMDKATVGQTEAEAVEIYGDKETWCNDMRTD